MMETTQLEPNPRRDAPLPKPTAPLKVAILGATGAVGQRLVQLLEGHPWFELAEVLASERSAGRPYREAAHWLLPTPLPAAAAELRVERAGVELRSPLVFSALDSATAETLEPRYAGAGHIVVSNASRFRMDPRVPLLIPEVNPESLELLASQEWAASGGGLVTNPNCSVVGLVLALAPLHRAFGIRSVAVTTLQALSGAGYPGVASLDALANVIPWISGEEEKIATEPLKILGAEFPISAAVHRVPVVDGHTEAVGIDLVQEASVAEIRRTLAEFTAEPQNWNLPTAPKRPVVVLDEPDRPQPARDVDREGGMSVFVGRLREDPVFDVRFTLLVHNTVRGAAGAALLNGELLVARGLVGGHRQPALEAP